MVKSNKRKRDKRCKTKDHYTGGKSPLSTAIAASTTVYSKKKKIRSSAIEKDKNVNISKDFENNSKPGYISTDEMRQVNVTTGVMNLSSWATSFSKAAAVKPLDLGSDYNVDDSLKSPSAHGVDLVSKLSLETGYGRKEEHDGINDNEREEVRIEKKNPTPLEGRMVEKGSESILVLLDRQSGLVFSPLDKEADGTMRTVGRILQNDNVELWNLDTIDNITSDREKDSTIEGTPQRSPPSALPSFPFPTDPDDHCESPAISYKDIAPLLSILAKWDCNGKVDTLPIYDPYYCNGAVVRNLSSLGFTLVTNKKEDCYHMWKNHSKQYPSHRALVTNPPYSSDHLERLLSHVFSSDTSSGCVMTGRAWFLLMPVWVHKRKYYRHLIDTELSLSSNKNSDTIIRPFYLVPRKRYVYLPPPGFRKELKSDVHKKSSPFPSMWYVWGGTQKRTEEMIKCFETSEAASRCHLARSRAALRDLRRDIKN